MHFFIKGTKTSPHLSFITSLSRNRRDAQQCIVDIISTQDITCVLIIT